MRGSRRARMVALCGILVCAACATRQPLTGQPVQGFDEKLSTFAYIEDGDLVTLIVDTHAARDKDGQPYVPLEIAVANHGFRALSLTREAFTLIDGEGNRYPVAGARELISGYDMLDFDRGLAELPSIVGTRFAALQRYPTNFSPTLAVSTGSSDLVRDLVALPKHGYIIDFLYFPAPKTGVRGKPFELHLDTPELTDPVFVKFEVR
jgi:hypothetical protein